MATNKNALIRYKILDSCFRNPGKRYFINDLIEACNKILLENDSGSNGISRRQIFEDLIFMESSDGWEIELNRHKEGKRVFYRYADTNFSINNMPLNETEIHHLKDAINILAQFKGMPQFEWINELLPKLKQGIATQEISDTIMEFDSNQYLKGIEHLGVLYNAIFYKKPLSINYQPYEYLEATEIILHPYFLKQYSNRWFLFGYNPTMDKYDWNLALDRMVSIKEIKQKYNNNNQIDWQEYFEDIVGVTKPLDAGVKNIVLHFKGKTGKYVETKPLHGSQKSKWLDKETLEVKLQLIINYELERLILSYADSALVIKPQSLVNVVKGRLSEAISLYG